MPTYKNLTNIPVTLQNNDTVLPFSSKEVYYVVPDYIDKKLEKVSDDPLLSFVDLGKKYSAGSTVETEDFLTDQTVLIRISSLSGNSFININNYSEHSICISEFNPVEFRNPHMINSIKVISGEVNIEFWRGQVWR